MQIKIVNNSADIKHITINTRASPVVLVAKSPPAKVWDTRDGFNPWVKKIHGSWKRHPTLVFLPGKFHGQISLAGAVPEITESDMTERLSTQNQKRLT